MLQLLKNCIVTFESVCEHAKLCNLAFKPLVTSAQRVSDPWRRDCLVAKIWCADKLCRLLQRMLHTQLSEHPIQPAMSACVLCAWSCLCLRKGCLLQETLECYSRSLVVFVLQLVNFKRRNSCCVMLSTRGRQDIAQLQLRLQHNTDATASATTIVKSISVRDCAACASA